MYKLVFHLIFGEEAENKERRRGYKDGRKIERKGTKETWEVEGRKKEER